MVAVEDGDCFLQSTGFILWALACSSCLNGFDDKSLVGNETSHNFVYTLLLYLPVVPLLVILL